MEQDRDTTKQKEGLIQTTRRIGKALNGPGLSEQSKDVLRARAREIREERKQLKVRANND